MTRTATLFLATALLCVALAQCAQAQQPLISIESSSVPMVESFDSLGTAAHGFHPTGGPYRVADAIYGVNDGLGAVFGIVSGVAGAINNQQHYVLSVH